MRVSRVRGVLVAIVVAAALAASSVPTASALVPGVVDLAVEVESLPETVAPPGAGVVYRVTVTNAGVAPGLSSEVTVTLPAGFTLIGAPDGCDVDGAVLTCGVGLLLPTQAVSLDVLAGTAPVVGDHVVHAAVRSTDPLEPVEFTGNNAATATTQVRQPDTVGQSHAFVCGGCSLDFSGETGDVTVSVPTHQWQDGALVAVPGVFVLVRDDFSWVGTPCGDSVCGSGPHIGFAEEDEEPAYQVRDPRNPVRVDYVAADQPPCRGSGNLSCGPTLFYFDPKQEGMTAPAPLVRCDGAGSGSGSGTGEAFVGGEYRICADQRYKVGNRIGVVALMMSRDPDIPRLI